MGKKHKKGKSAESGKTVDFPAKVKRETLDIVQQLLEKCTVQGGTKKEWDWYTEIFGLVSRLREIQAPHILKVAERGEHMAEFTDWLVTQEVVPGSVAVAECDHGLGLTAHTDIKEHDLILKIPRKLIMSTQTAKESALGELMTEDRILQSMPNVVLALHLLCEAHNPHSFWKPYLNVLPSTYSTPLYFTIDEVKLLKGSPLLDEVMNQYRSIARQYAYFYKLFHNSEASKPPLMPFCYDDYRWAVSTVMTRQNKVPSENGEEMLTAFIPMYDMANHANGELTTDFNLKEDCLKCFAMRNFTQEEQVFIFYGQRSNAEFLLHNGFIYPQNEFDRVNVKLGISKNDPLYSMKAELLARVSLLPSRLFSFYKGEDPVDSDTLAYLRIFNMDKGELESYLTGERSKLTSHLRDFSEVVCVGNEQKVWKFLETRLQLLLRAYPRSQEEERSLLQSDTLSTHGHLCVQLTFQEKKLLEHTARYAREYHCKIELEVQRHNMGVVSIGGGVNKGEEPVNIEARDLNEKQQEGGANIDKEEPVHKGGGDSNDRQLEQGDGANREEPVATGSVDQQDTGENKDVDLDAVQCL